MTKRFQENVNYSLVEIESLESKSMYFIGKSRKDGASKK